MVAITGGGDIIRIYVMCSLCVPTAFRDGIQGVAGTLHSKNSKPPPPLGGHLGGLKLGQK